MELIETDNVSHYYSYISEADKINLGNRIDSPISLICTDPYSEIWLDVKHENENIGYLKLSLDTQNNTAKISQVFIKPEFRNKGLGKELYTTLFSYLSEKVDVVYSEIIVSNKPSISLHSKVMTMYGTKPASYLYNGTRYDTVLFYKYLEE